MPRRDGTGPMGMGAMTGRKLGICSGINTPDTGGWFGRGCGRGYGRGFARNWGFGFGRNPGLGAHQTAHKQALQAKKEQLQIELEAIDKRLESL